MRGACSVTRLKLDAPSGGYVDGTAMISSCLMAAMAEVSISPGVGVTGGEGEVARRIDGDVICVMTNVGSSSVSELSISIIATTTNKGDVRSIHVNHATVAGINDPVRGIGVVSTIPQLGVGLIGVARGKMDRPASINVNRTDVVTAIGPTTETEMSVGPNAISSDEVDRAASVHIDAVVEHHVQSGRGVRIRSQSSSVAGE